MARPALVAGLLWLGAGPLASPTTMAAGIVDAVGSTGVGNLRFSFADPAAVLTWPTDWYGEVGAYAHADNVGDNTGYWYVIGNNDSTAKAAQVPGAVSQSGYAVADGANVAIGPNAAVAAEARAAIALADPSRQADGYAYATFSNYFSIGSANPLGATVETTISLDYTGIVQSS